MAFFCSLTLGGLQAFCHCRNPVTMLCSTPSSRGQTHSVQSREKRCLANGSTKILEAVHTRLMKVLCPTLQVRWWWNVLSLGLFKVLHVSRSHHGCWTGDEKTHLILSHSGHFPRRIFGQSTEEASHFEEAPRHACVRLMLKQWNVGRHQLFVQSHDQATRLKPYLEMIKSVARPMTRGITRDPSTRPKYCTSRPHPSAREKQLQEFSEEGPRP